MRSVLEFAPLMWIVLLIVGLALNRMFWHSRPIGRPKSLQDEPILSSADLLGGKGLQSMAKGTIDEFPYNLLVNDAGKVMMYISLGRNTRAHIIAIGNYSDPNGVPLNISDRWLEPVGLEGDFPEYFRMYCTKGMQIETRQVFGPETMANFVDFCKAYNFELYHDMVYISVANDAHDTTDTTTMVTDITRLVQHNRRVFRNI